MSTATLIPLIAAPRAVDVKAIDRELAELWRAAAASSEAERIALSRARTLTLVAYAPTPDAGARLAEVAARTRHRRRPCRPRPTPRGAPACRRPFQSRRAERPDMGPHDHVAWPDRALLRPAAHGGARPDHAHPRGARGLVARAGTALRRVAGGTDALAGGAAFHPRRRAVAGDAGGPARPRHSRLPARGVARAASRRGPPVHADRHRESSGAERRGDLLHRAQRRRRQRHRRRRE